MTDRDIRFTFIPNRYPDRVQRAAVLYPLTRICATEAEVRLRTQKLINMWQARVDALVRVGWEPRTNVQHAAHFARNCLPAFIATHPATRACRTSYVCPFCHARWVRTIWQMADAAFQNPKEKKQDLSDDQLLADFIDDPLLPGQTIADDPRDPTKIYPYHLVEYVSKVTVAYQPAIEHELTMLCSMIRETLSRRQRMITWLNPTGAFLYDTIEPGHRGWLVRSRHLLKVEADAILPSTYGSHDYAKLKRHDQPTREVLFGAVARVCRFPTLLITGDAERTRLILQAKQITKARMSERYRGFRKRKFN